MDFSNRNAQNTQSQAAVPGTHTATGNSVPSGQTTNSHRGHKSGSDDSKWGRIATVVLAAAIVILLGAVIAVTAAGNNQDKTKTTESGFVDSKKLQAVFLNTGQVYFGNIKVLNSQYFVVSNIYYLQTSGSDASGASTANTSVSLVKLGCELHEPEDRMVINRDQVTFWENLHDSGQVAKAVATFKKDNPNGQKCADQRQQPSTDSSNKVQSAKPNN